MKKQFSVALLALAISQVSQAGIVGDVLGGIASQAEPISGQEFSLGNNPVTNTQLAGAIAQLDAALPAPLGSPAGDAPGLPAGPEDLIAMIPVQAPGEGSTFEPLTPGALAAALTSGSDLLPVPATDNFEAAADVIQTTLTNAGGGEGPGPQDYFIEGLQFADQQFAQGVNAGAGALFTVMAEPSAQGKALADGSYALQAANTFATEFAKYNELFAGDGGSPAAPLYVAISGGQEDLFGALQDGADQIAEVEGQGFQALVDGAFGAPETFRETVVAPLAAAAQGGSGDGAPDPAAIPGMIADAVGAGAGGSNPLTDAVAMLQNSAP